MFYFLVSVSQDKTDAIGISFSEISSLIAIVTALSALFLSRVRAEAQELDRKTFKTISGKMDIFEEKIEKMVEKLMDSMAKLAETASKLDKEIEVVKNKLESVPVLYKEIREMQKYQSEIDKRVASVEHHKLQ